jgi:hypothetical protein
MPKDSDYDLSNVRKTCHLCGESYEIWENEEGWKHLLCNNASCDNHGLKRRIFTIAQKKRHDELMLETAKEGIIGMFKNG